MKIKIFALLLSILFLNTQLYSQTVNWATETGLALGSTFVNGQVITNFAGTGVTVTINVNVVGGDPSINASDGTIVQLQKNDGAAFSLTTSGGTQLDVLLSNHINLQDGESITVSNVDGQNITITETSSNGGSRMTVDGVSMSGSLPSTIVENDAAVVNEVDNGVGTQWNATMSSITSFTWLWNNDGTGTIGREGFVLTIQGTTLPIELLDFTATSFEGNFVKLDWQTASEINNKFFTIERSKNGMDWEEISVIDGAGNSSSLLSYSTIDNNPYFSISYYRLKQTDFDGQFEYSRIRSVRVDKSLSSSVVIYPNPTSDKLTIIGDSFELKQIKIFNSMGQDITNFIPITSSNERGIIVIDMTKLNTGMYYIKTKTTANKVYKQ